MYHFYSISPGNGHEAKGGPNRYIAVFKNRLSPDKIMGKSSPMEAKEIEEFNADAKLPSDTTLFIFEVPSTTFNLVQGVINSYLKDLRVKEKKESFDEKNLNDLMGHLNNLGHKLEPLEILGDRKKQTTDSNKAAALKDREKELQTKLDVSQRALAATREAEENLQRENKNLEGQVQREKQKNGTPDKTLQARLIAEADGLRKELIETRKDRDLFQKQLSVLKTNKDSASKELTALRENLNDLQQKSSEAVAKKADAEQKLEAAEATNKTLQKTINDQTQAIQRLTAKTDNHPQQLQHKDDEISRLSKDNANLKRKDKDLQQQLDDQTKTASGLQEKLTAEQTTNKELQRQLEQANNEKRETARVVQQLRQDKANLISKRSTTEKTLEDTQGNLKLKSEALQKEQTKSSGLQQQLDDQTTTANNLKGKLATQQKTNEALQETISDQTQVIQRLTSQTDNHPQQLKDKDDEISRLNNAAGEKEQAHQAQLQQIKSNYQGQIDEAVSQKETAEKKLEASQGDLQLERDQSLKKDTEISRLNNAAGEKERAHQGQLQQIKSNYQGQIDGAVTQKETAEKKLKASQSDLQLERDQSLEKDTEISRLNNAAGEKKRAHQAQLQQTQSSAQLKIDDAVSQKIEVEQKLGAAEKANEALQKTIDNQTQAIQQLTAQTDNHPQQLKDKDDEISRLNNAAGEKEQAHQNQLHQVKYNYQGQIDEAVSQKTAVEKKLGAAETTNNALQETIDDQTQAIQQLTAQTNSHPQQLQNKDDEISRLHKLAEEKEQAYQAQLQQTQSNAQLKIDDAVSQKETTEKKLEASQIDLQLERDQSLEKDHQISQLRTAVENLEEQVSQFPSELAQTIAAKEETLKSQSAEESAALRTQLEKTETTYKTALKTQAEEHRHNLEETQRAFKEQIEEADRNAVSDKKTIEALQEQVKQLPELNEQLTALRKKAETSDLALPREYKKAHFSQAPLSSTMRDNLKKGATSMGETTTNEREESTTLLSSNNPFKGKEANPSFQRIDSNSSTSSGNASLENADIELTTITPPADDDSGRGSPTHSIPESPTTPLKEKYKQLMEGIVKEKIAAIDINNYPPLVAEDRANLKVESIFDSIFSKIDSAYEEGFIKLAETHPSMDDNELKAALLNEFKKDMGIDTVIEHAITQLQEDKKNKIQEILALLTPEAVIDKLHEVAQDAFKQALSDSENSTTIPTHISERLKEEMASLPYNTLLETFKKHLQKELKNASLLTLDQVETNNLVINLLDSPKQPLPTLRERAEKIAKHHAENHKIRSRAQAIASGLFKETIENTDAFKTRLDNLGLSSQALVTQLKDNPANGTFLADLEASILPQLNAAEIDQVIDAQKMTDIQTAIPSELLSQIDPVLERTLTELEAKQTKQQAIDGRLSKISPKAVLERLQKEALEALDKQLSAAGDYQTDEALLTTLNKSLLTLAQNHFATAKKRLHDNLSTQTLAAIQALNDDAVIDNLINTKLDQATSKKTLQTEASTTAENLAKELIDRYKDKKPADLEKIYSDSLISIDSSIIGFAHDRSAIGFAQAKKILTSRGLMLWIDKEARALTQIEQDISSGKLTHEQTALQDKINSNSNLDTQEKASYEKSIQLIEAIKAKHEDIKTTLNILGSTKRALQIHIDINDKDQNQALINIAMPATRQHAIIATDSYQALIEARNKANTTPATKDHVLTGEEKDETYKNESFVEKQTLLLSTNITNQPDGKGHVVTIKICKEDARSKLYIDSIDNDDTYSSGRFFSRKTPIERYSNTAENVSFITQSMLENAQGTGNTPAEKGTGVLIINSHRPEWLNIYVELLVQKRLQPEQKFPFIQIEGPALDFLINDKKREQFKDKIEKLIEKRIKHLSVAESKMTELLGMDSNNARAALRGPGKA